MDSRIRGGRLEVVTEELRRASSPEYTLEMKKRMTETRRPREKIEDSLQAANEAEFLQVRKRSM